MTNTPHDALFKSVFQQPEHAAAELQHVLPTAQATAIDWTTLALEPGSYVDEDLADQHSDLLFSAEARGSHQRVFVYLLFEHQSSPEPKMALRLLSYMVSIWKRFSDSDKESALPLIVPAVLAHVSGGWTAPTRFSDLFSANVGALADTVLPDFAYAVDDLGRTDDTDLRKRAVANQARLALWLMRDARDSALLLQRLVDWLIDIEELACMPGGARALTPLLHYITRVCPDLQLAQIRAILSRRAPTAERITMTIAEQLHAEGKAEGRAQGQAEGRAQGKAEGRAQGKAEGRAQGKAEALVLMLEGRGFQVDVRTRDRLHSMAVEDLDVLLRHAASVASVDDLFDV